MIKYGKMDSMNKKKKINWEQVRQAIVELPEKEYRIADEICDFIKLDEKKYLKRGFDTESVIARIMNMTEQRLRRRYSHETGFYDAKYNGFNDTYAFSEGFVEEEVSESA